MVKTVFLCGIAGTGMSALAGLFHEAGWRVFGSDSRFYPPVDRLLAELGVTLFQGFDPGNIPAGVDLCVVGNAISRGNPEAEFILDRRLEYLSMAEALQRHFLRGKRSIVVAGSHGKTTTASFVAHLLDVAGLEPGFFIGGKPGNFAANYRTARGEFFVSEGDEYETAFFDRSAKFFKYRPELLLLTALEHDHLDFYATPESYLQSFRNLVNQVPARRSSSTAAPAAPGRSPAWPRATAATTSCCGWAAGRGASTRRCPAPTTPGTSPPASCWPTSWGCRPRPSSGRWPASAAWSGG